jgi:hypothetical protein
MNQTWNKINSEVCFPGATKSLRFLISKDNNKAQLLEDDLSFCPFKIFILAENIKPY